MSLTRLASTRGLSVNAARVALTLLPCLVLFVGCSDSATAPAPVLTAMTVQLASSQVQVSATTAATALGVDQNGNAIATGPVTWVSSTPSVATVDANGLVTAVGPGNSDITATAGGISAEARIRVTQPLPQLAAITVTLSATPVTQGATASATAAGLDQYGFEFPPELPIAWTSSDERVATVDSTGMITALSPGSTVIRAVSIGIVGTVPLEVVPAAFQAKGVR